VGNVLPARKDIMNRFYFAGAELGHSAGNEHGEMITDYMASIGIENALYSYYYVNDFPHYLEKFKNVFLDSGAFTADAKGEEIDLEKYAKFIKANQDEIDVYINVDVIGNGEATYQNQKELEKKGLDPLPVFHINEDFKFLERYVDEGYEYICLGGMVGERTSKLKPWIRKCFEKIPDETKIHAFGVARPELLNTFDFYSADATNWMFGQKFGHMYYFQKGKLHRFDQEEFARRFAAMDDYNKRNKWNLIQWKKYADYLREEKI